MRSTYYNQKKKFAGRISHPLPGDSNKEIASIPDIKKNVHLTSIENRTKYNKIKSFRQDQKLGKTGKARNWVKPTSPRN